MAAVKREVIIEIVDDREIIMRRAFDAPRDLVWEAFADASSLTHWWGPHGFATTVHAMDLQTGGAFKHTMHGPDGTDYPTEAVFTDVHELERIAYTMHDGGIDGEREMRCEVEWTFEERGGETNVTLRMRFPTAAALAHAEESYGVRKGGSETLERLGGRLAYHGKDRA